MAKRTVNRKVLRAMSIGLAAMMTVQPILATPVLADEDTGSVDKVDEVKSTDTVDSLTPVQTESTEAVTAVNDVKSSLDQAVASGRDSEQYASFDKNGGQALNEKEQAVLNSNIFELNKDNSTIKTNANTITNDRNSVAVDAQKLVEEAKRGVPSNYDNKSGGDTKLDASEIIDAVDGILTGEAAEAAKDLDNAINERGNELAELNDNIESSEASIEGNEGIINIAIDDIESATSIPSATEALENAESAKNTVDQAYTDAEKEYERIASEQDAKKAAIQDLAAKYDSYLDKASEGATQAKAELDQAKKDLEALESAANKAQRDLANTAIGKLAGYFDNTKSAESWGNLDVLVRDVIKYYYMPSVLGDDVKNFTVANSFTKPGNNSENYIKVTINKKNGETEYRYFNYKSNYSMYSGKAYNDKIVIFEKNAAVEVEAHYEDSSNEKVDVTEALSVASVTDPATNLIGKIIVNNGGEENTFYKVTGTEGVVNDSFVPADDTEFDDNGEKKTYATEIVSTSSEITGNKLVESTLGKITTTTVKRENVSLEDASYAYDTEADATNASSKEAINDWIKNSLGNGYELDGDVSYDSKVETSVTASLNNVGDTKFSTTIDLNIVTNRTQHDADNKAGLKDAVIDHLNAIGSNVDYKINGDIVTFTYTKKTSVNESVEAENEEDAKNALFNKLATGIFDGINLNKYFKGSIDNVTDNIVKILGQNTVADSSEIKLDTKYNLILSNINYNVLSSSSETSEPTVISTKAWDVEKLTFVDTVYETIPTLNDNFTNYVEKGIESRGIIDMREGSNDSINAKVRKDLENYKSLQEQYKKTEEAAVTAKEKVENAAKEVQDVIDAIAAAKSNLKDDLAKKLDELDKQLKAAKDKLEVAEAEKVKADDAFDKAKEAYDEAVDRLTPAPATPASGTTGATATPASPATPAAVVVTPIAAPVAAIPAGAGSVVAPAGVAGVRTESTGIGSEEDGTGFEETKTGDGKELVGEEKVKDEKALKDKKQSKKTTIKDEKTPLSDMSNKKMNWWWLLLVALGIATEEKYRHDKKKEKEEALGSEIDK